MTFLPEPSESAAADRQSDGLTTDEARRRLAKIGPNATPRIGILTVPRGPVAWQKGCRMRLSDLHEASDVWVRWPASAGSAEASGEPLPSGVAQQSAADEPTAGGSTMRGEQARVATSVGAGRSRGRAASVLVLPIPRAARTAAPGRSVCLVLAELGRSRVTTI